MLNFYLFLSFTAGVFIGYYLSSLSLKLFFFILSFFFLYLFYKKSKDLPFEISLISCFLFLGSLWIQPQKEIYEFLGKKQNFFIKVISIPQKKNLYQKYLSFIEDEDKRIKLKAYTLDYSSEKKYLASYWVEARLILKKRYKKIYLIIKKDGTKKEIDSFFSKFFRQLTLRILKTYQKYLSFSTYQFLAGVFLGRKEIMPFYIKKIFRESGLSHLLAISGLHIAILGGFLVYLLRFFYIKFRARIIISNILLYFYNFLVGFNPATLRATVMYTVFSLGFLLKKRVHPLNSLGIAGLFLEFLNPYLVFDIGFQLSFISVFAIIFGYQFFGIKLRAKNYILLYLKNIFFSSLFVNIFILPLLLYYFVQINLLNLLENFLVIGYFSLIIFINFIFLLLSIHPFFLSSLGVILSLLTDGFLKIIKFFSSIKILKLNLSFSLTEVFIYYIVLILVLIFIRNISQNKLHVRFEWLKF